jgi:Kef-type K+ transport system membrane component KefB
MNLASQLRLVPYLLELLATMPYAQEIGSRLRPLRDFFVIVFFIALGTKLNVGDVQKRIRPCSHLLWFGTVW